MVADPADYPWSSYSARMGNDEAVDWPDRDPCYQALGDTEAQRQRRYAAFVQESIPPEEWRLIREALQRGQLTGNDRFVADVEVVLGRRIERRRRGHRRRIGKTQLNPSQGRTAWVPKASSRLRVWAISAPNTASTRPHRS